VLIDLAVPRDVEPAVRDVPGAVVFDVDDLDAAVLPAATGVELAVELESASAGVRAFLAAGGGRWLERRLVDTVHNLAEVARLASLAGWPDSVTGEWAV
jgi:glutamyl-tRNA reductase